MRPRRPNPRPAALLAAFAVVAGTSGCGGRDGPDPDWRARADAVCADVAREAEADVARGDLTRAAALVREQADRLDDVDGPPALGVLARRTRAAGATVEALARGRAPVSDAALAGLKRRTAQLTRDASRLGLAACARGTP